MSDMQWSLIEGMTKFDPAERVKISFVADRLSDILVYK